jgi:signal transduction histidine kinase
VRTHLSSKSELSTRTLNFWFIPGMLVCVFVLSGLCLFFIRRQMNSEEERLRDLERFSLDQTQQLFRQEVEKRWQTAFRQFPERDFDPFVVHAWDLGLGNENLGFCVDNSGMLVHPAYQISPDSGLSAKNHRYGQARDSLSGKPMESAAVSEATEAIRASTNVEDRFRQLLIKRKDRERVEELCVSLMRENIRTQIEDGLPLRLPVVTLYLEFKEATPDIDSSQSLAIDTLLGAYAEDLIPLTPSSASWLGRLREQCRNRRGENAWLQRESMVARLVMQRQFAEKFLGRINLLIRRNLYNVSRFDLPVQYLSSDPSENPVLVAYKFVNRPPLGLLGVAIHLEGLCLQLEELVEKSSWLSPEVKIHIGRELSNLAPAKLTEQRILDPWASQFLVQAMPKDFSAFERRSLQKNLLYLTTVLITVLSCILVLFFGNRALKEHERFSKLRTDFLTNVSHELKTPLTAIRLHAETLERGVTAADRSTAISVETIIEETDRLSRLISDVLEFTRLENDKRVFDWEVVDLVSVIRESLQLFSQQFAEEGFEVSVDLPENLILQKADRAALKQTAVNLISNGIKFSQDRKRLRLSLNRDGDRAIWEVEDGGVGIHPEELPHIFEKFYRGSKLDPAISGTGLGLTLCKAFVEAHGGTIRARSIPGQGCTFIIILPVGKEPEVLLDSEEQSRQIGTLNQEKICTKS